MLLTLNLDVRLPNMETIEFGQAVNSHFSPGKPFFHPVSHLLQRDQFQNGTSDRIEEAQGGFRLDLAGVVPANTEFRCSPA